jgi:hypothetical protein
MEKPKPQRSSDQDNLELARRVMKRLTEMPHKPHVPPAPQKDAKIPKEKRLKRRPS